MSKKINMEKYFAPNLDKARKRTRNIIEEVRFNLTDAHQKIGFHKTYLIHTYGCQGNVADSETMAVNPCQ